MQIDSLRSSEVVDFVKQRYCIKEAQRLTISEYYLAIYADYFNLDIFSNSIRFWVREYGSDRLIYPSLVYNSDTLANIYRVGSR